MIEVTFWQLLSHWAKNEIVFFCHISKTKRPISNLKLDLKSALDSLKHSLFNFFLSSYNFSDIKLDLEFKTHDVFSLTDSLFFKYLSIFVLWFNNIFLLEIILIIYQSCTRTKLIEWNKEKPQKMLLIWQRVQSKYKNVFNAYLLRSTLSVVNENIKILFFFKDLQKKRNCHPIT